MKSSNASRQNILETLSEIDGVYVPSFYEANYNTDGTFKELVSLKNKNINVTLRETKGHDIAAACGQLKAKKEMENEK